MPCALKPTRASLSTYARTRREELDGFVEGLFGPNEDLHLPSSATERLDRIGEIRGHFFGAGKLFEKEDVVASAKELSETVKNLKAISDIAEMEISGLVQVCARVRRLGK